MGVVASEEVGACPVEAWGCGVSPIVRAKALAADPMVDREHARVLLETAEAAEDLLGRARVLRAKILELEELAAEIRVRS